MLAKLQNQIERVILGKSLTVQLCLTAFLAGEHLLLEDVPGVGKTLLAKTLARCVNAEFRRIQFTPDLLPSEITGTSVPNALVPGAVGTTNFCEVDSNAAGLSATNSNSAGSDSTGLLGSGLLATGSKKLEPNESGWCFMPGPVFANIVLADEINRATPRTQSALLEAMGERRVTTDGVTRPLPDPFFVIATQNPMEFEGTFPLPESQLDRFLMRISIGYAPREQEKELLTRRFSTETDFIPTTSLDEIRSLQEETRNVRVEESIVDYLMDLADATRRDPLCRVGVSTRGLQALYRATQAWAKIQGRDYAVPDDVKFLAVPVLAHRIVLKSSFKNNSRENAEDFLKKILERVLVP